MSRIFPGSGGHYELLDDHFEEENDLDPGNHDNTHTDSLISDNDNASQSSRAGILSAIQQIKIPRINFAYVIYAAGSISSKKKRCLDLIVCIISLLVVHCLCLGLGYYTVLVHKPAPVIDKSYTAFKIPYHKASLNNEAFQTAKKNHTSFLRAQLQNLQHATRSRHSTRRSVPDKSEIIGGKPGGSYDRNHLLRKKRSYYNGDSRDNSFVEVPLQYYPQWKMQVIFLAEEGENIFTKEKLQKIHEVEKKIIKHEKFPDFCFKDTHPVVKSDPAVKAVNGCSPLNSLLTYFFPSRDGNGNVFYDGLGENMDNIDSALKLAMTSTNFYYYVDDKTNTSNRKSQLLRTEVLFGTPLKGFKYPYKDREEQSKKYKKFIITYIDLLSKASDNQVSVLYGGNEIFDYEIETTFWNDVKLAGFALGAIFILMLILTSGSLWLTIMGLCSILLSAPLAIFFYRVVFKIIGLGILNGAAAFVIIGIGVDDVFVFVNVFRQADHIKNARSRTWFTMKTAGKATFFTSFTTAAAFAANIASMIPAVHDFGLFMCLIVANCWVTVMLIMPPALYIWYISFSVCESSLLAAVCRCKTKGSSLKLPKDVANFMDGNHDNLNEGNYGILTREVNEDDDVDVPMLSMDQPTQYADDDDDEPILLDPDPLVVPEDFSEEKKQKNCLGAFLQAVLYHYLALPFIKVRWVIIVISTVMLAISIGLVTQLHTSSKPPQFFKANTNIQRLLDLKAKFSTIDTVSCNDCSAIYSIGQMKEPTRPTYNNPPITARPYPPETSKPDLPVTYRPVTPAPAPRQTTAEKTKTKPGKVKSKTELPKTTTTTTTTRRPATRKLITARPHTFYPKTPAPPRHFTPVPPQPAHHPDNPNIPKPTAKSVPKDFDACQDRDCSKVKERPLLEFGATVYVVVGVKHFHWKDTNTGHVMQQTQGVVEFDKDFSKMFNFSNPNLLEGMKQLCQLCKVFAKNSELVRNGSAQCLPMSSIPSYMRSILISSVPECRDLPQVSSIYGRQQPAHAVGGLTADGTAILWLGFAFESTTSKGKSYFQAYKDYQKWEDFLQKVKDNITKYNPNSPLVDMFQTSDFWPEVLMEVVAVNSAIYGVVLSIIICMIAVMIFTGHVLLLLIIFICIAEMVCLVVGIFYMLHWEIGGVEAVSLSILVGSSVDYCVHLVEGYILAAQACPVKDNPAKARQWRTSAAFSHIGVSILSSALTTIIAAVPLTQTAIQPFSKFGQIIAINTAVCIVYSLTVCTAFLSTVGPAFFKPSWKSIVKSVIGTCVFVGVSVLSMFIMSKCGVHIPGPNGSNLF